MYFQATWIEILRRVKIYELSIAIWLILNVNVEQKSLLTINYF